MFMVLKEDIQNLVFKCEKVLESNEIKLKRLKKEEKMLAKVIKGYVVSDDNCITFNEINNRFADVVQEIAVLKIDGKSIKKILSRIRPLLTSMDIVEDDNEEEESEIGKLE